MLPFRKACVSAASALSNAITLLAEACRFNAATVKTLSSNGTHAGTPRTPADKPARVQTLRKHDGSVTALAAYGCHLLSGSTDCTVRLWRAAADRQALLFPHFEQVDPPSEALFLRRCAALRALELREGAGALQYLPKC